MGDTLSIYIKTTTKVLLFSLLAFFVFYFSSTAYDMLYHKQNLNAITMEMQKHEEIKDYITSESVTGDDVIVFIANFRRDYDIIIRQIAKSDYALSKWNGNNVDWNMEEVIDIIGSNTNANFEVIAHYDNNDEITQIEFDMQ